MLESLEKMIMMIFKGYFPVMIIGSLIACYIFYTTTVFKPLEALEIDGLGVIQVGDSLMHSEYGIGIVKEIKNKKILEINFESEGDKTIFTAKKNLTKVSE